MLIFESVIDCDFLLNENNSNKLKIQNIAYLFDFMSEKIYIYICNINIYKYI